LQARLKLTRVEPFKGLVYNGWLTALPVNIRLVLEWLIVPNALTYYDPAKNIAIKSFIVLALGRQWIELDRTFIPPKKFPFEGSFTL
jgi:hypothetical protein